MEPVKTVASDIDEEIITRMVRRFYAFALEDDLLGPMFRQAIPDLEAHLPIVDDFWSHALLGTHRYKGHPYTHHVHLKVVPAHFDRWMAHFERAVREVLPADAAGLALKRARHMTQSFRMGLLPLEPPKVQ